MMYGAPEAMLLIHKYSSHPKQTITPVHAKHMGPTKYFMHIFVKVHCTLKGIMFVWLLRYLQQTLAVSLLIQEKYDDTTGICVS